jgi:hypothetical protein
VWVLLKLSARHCCKSFRILNAGKGVCGMSNSAQEKASFSKCATDDIAALRDFDPADIGS